MAIEKTVSELAEILGVSRQAVNNRVKSFPEEYVEKNDKGVTVVNRAGLIKLEEIYKKTIFEDEPVSEEAKLTLTAMQDKEQLKLELDEAKAEVEEIQSQQEGIKKGFFARLFGGK